MTRAAKSVVRRIVGTGDREYVVEVRADVVRLKPLGARWGGPAEVALKWTTVYIRGFQPRPKRRRLRRGL